MKTSKMIGVLLHVAALLFYLASIACFASSKLPLGIIGLALGSAFLCFGSMYARKTKQSKNNEEKK